VADIEFRLAQQYELMRRAESGGMEKVYVEDIVAQKHHLTGYTLTNNTPAGVQGVAGITWASLHIVHLGVDYTIADGTTTNRYVWFVQPGSYTPPTQITLITGNAIPTLTVNDMLVFVNNAGIATSASESGVAAAVGVGAVGDEQISGGISQTKIVNLSTVLSGIGTDIQRVEAKADGAIQHHFGPDFPWANSTVQNASTTGDIYTAQLTTDATNRPNGRSWKWSGAGGTPANTWILITDSDLTKALADAAAAKGIAMGKTTAYYRTVAQGAPPVPTDGYAVGDEWVQSDNDNYTQRWTGSAWVSALIGNAAITTGISGTKIGPGINGANVGAGVNGAVLGTATGQVTVAKINAAFHMLY
jgi:hypothetical protein